MLALLALSLNLGALAFLLRAFYPEHFYEADEPVEQVLAAFNTGSPVIFSEYDETDMTNEEFEARMAVAYTANISYPFVVNATAGTAATIVFTPPLYFNS